MLELFGALALTAIAVVLAIWIVGLGWMGLAFGGPTLLNWLWMLVCLIPTAGIMLGWWLIVGTHIHISFG